VFGRSQVSRRVAPEGAAAVDLDEIVDVAEVGPDDLK
jgi:hypothetical protein